MSARPFTTKDGRRARFNNVAFREAVIEATWRPNPERPGKILTRKDVFRKIATILWNPSTEEQMENCIGTIKQWFQCNNGPSIPEEGIYKMAECLGLKNDQFIEYLEEEKKEMKTDMETNKLQNTIITLSPDHLTNDYFLAMMKMKAQEEAYKLHEMFLDLIAAYNEADMATWLGTEPLSTEWITAAKKYPSRCPVELAVHKSSCYLSKKLRYDLFAFLEDMYGSSPFDWYEINKIRDDPSFLSNIEDSEFISKKLERFSEYLKIKEINEAALDTGDRESWMFSFLQDESIDRYFELERIFEDFIVE